MATKKSKINKAITFTQLESELGVSIVNAIFGFNDFTHRVLTQTCRYYFARLLFNQTLINRSKLLSDIKFYFQASRNGTPVEWLDVVGKYEDYLSRVDLLKLDEYNSSKLAGNFEIK